MKDFKINSKLKPMGDQPKAIDELVNSINSGNKYQTLFGCYWIWKNFYYGKCYREVTETSFSIGS